MTTAAPPEHASGAGHQRGTGQLAARFGINEENLARRRQFIRLSEDDRQELQQLETWAAKTAPTIAREFYDWQFSFPGTKVFFQEFAASRNLAVPTLRKQLEAAQSGYIASVFSGARTNWGLDYFEQRLNVGSVHDRINLPFKWYIGSYAEMLRLVKNHLRREVKDKDHAQKAEDAVSKVFNYDMQAVGDSFLLSTLESMGLDTSAIKQRAGMDKTECLDQVKNAIHMLREQCAALADSRLNDKVFDEPMACAGAFGKAFGQIRENFRSSLEQISRSSTELANSAEQLTSVSQQMAAVAEETAVQSKVVANASSTVSERVSAVATSANEMQRSIHDIASAANQSASIAQGAVKAVESANATMERLGESGVEIGKVTRLINSIAKQTNLLALNATLEAARAGDAGRGFAVVAREVKELADGSARATQEIGQRIDAMQNETGSAVAAIAQIGEVIRKINEIATRIATAVEGQTVMAKGIGMNAAEGASGSLEIASNICGLAEAAKETSKGATETQTASRSLRGMAGDLQTLVSRFQL